MATTRDVWIEAQNKARKEVRDAKHECPMCLTAGLVPLGGGGGSSFWFECPCGAYSALSTSWEAALANVEGWTMVDEDLNRRMSPPVGGS